MMSLPLNVNDLIHGRTVEWERIEFKKGWNPADILHSICAFANDINNWGGGYIVIGIESIEGKPILPPSGLAPGQADKIQKELLNLCNHLKPHYFPILEPIKIEGKLVFIIWVPGGQNRPYQAPVTLGEKPHFAYYIRRFSSTVKAQIEDERELLSLAGTIPFDDRMHHQAHLTDLKLPLIQAFLKEINSSLLDDSVNISFAQLCRQMVIVDGTDEYLKPRNAGLLFFNDMPQKFIPLSRIEIVHFATTPADNKLSEKIFQGPVQQQIRDVLTYLQNTTIREFISKLPDHAKTRRFYNYPYPALEEAVVNAFYHRSYEVREPIEIRIHPDRIEILSFPGPDRSIKQADIDQGRLVARRYRNRRIGEFLKELRLTEGRCTGIPKILKSMKDNGSPAPIFQTDDDRTYFIVTLPAHLEALREEHTAPIIEYGELESRIKAADESELCHLVPSLSQVCPKSVPSRNTALLLLKAVNESELLTLMSHVGEKNRTRFRTQYLKPLIEAGLLAPTIPDKPRSSRQKYRTTEKGKAVLEHLVPPATLS